MSSRFVRASNFRHVFADAPKHDDTYQNLALATATGDHNYIKGSAKFFSLSARGGGGPVYVIPYDQVGKLPSGYPTLSGHKGVVYDTDWNPFNDNIVATAGDDSNVCIWQIPDGGLTERMTEPVQVLSGHGKQVTLVKWHPVASNVIASAGKDPAIKVWDVESGEDKVTLSGFGGLVQDFDWNYNGSQLASSCKDKMLRVHNPRTGEVVQECQPHEGAKCFKLTWLGSSNRIVTCGFTRQSKREFKIWDPSDLSEPLKLQEIDQASGVMMPFFDEDTKILFIAGKGDGNIRYYEITDEAPYVYALSEYRTSVSQKGLAMLPKRACNPMKCEIARALKLTNASTVEPLSFVVPRKSESFQEDIFPDTRSGEASLSAAEWFEGADATPKLMSMDPAKNGGKTAVSSTFSPTSPTRAGAGAGAGAGAAPTKYEGKTAKEWHDALQEANKRIAELEAELAAAKA